MPVKLGDIEMYAGPDKVGAPDNLETVIVDFINGAQKRLEIAVQELENKEIAKAIISARQRKVTVKLVLEQDYLRASPASRTPWEYRGKNEDNRQIHDTILRANIDVKTDYNTSIFHQKFIIRDRTSVLTGSTNFTPTGTAGNLNHIVIIHDREVAKTYYREFREIQQGHFGHLNEGHDKVPKEIIVSDVRVKILFAPDHNPEMEIMKQMMKANKRIDFAIFTFSKSSGIDDTMMKLLELNIPIRGAMDARQGGQTWAATKPLAAKGADLFFVSEKDGVRKLHHKLMVLDDQVVIAGSFNYTGPANNLNDENIVVLGDLDTDSSVQRQAQSKLAKFARLEIDRIINSHGDPV